MNLEIEIYTRGDKNSLVAEQINVYYEDELCACFEPYAKKGIPLSFDEIPIAGLFGKEQQCFFCLKGKSYQYFSKRQLPENFDLHIFKVPSHAYISLINDLWRSSGFVLADYDPCLSAILDFRDLAPEDLTPLSY